jgi:hypothetical protein
LSANPLVRAYARAEKDWLSDLTDVVRSQGPLEKIRVAANQIFNDATGLLQRFGPNIWIRTMSGASVLRFPPSRAWKRQPGRELQVGDLSSHRVLKLNQSATVAGPKVVAD